MMTFLLSLLGLGGLAGVLFWLAPTLAVSIATKAVEAVLRAASWVGENGLEGLQGIFADWRRVLALLLVASAVGVYTDRFDPVRGHLPGWMQSRPAVASSPMKAAPKAKAAPAKTKPKPTGNAFSEFACNLTPTLCR
jgi:hypothetical protein